MALDASAPCALITKPNAGRDDHGQNYRMRPEPDEHPAEEVQDQKKDTEPDNHGHKRLQLFQHGEFPPRPRDGDDEYLGESRNGRAALQQVLQELLPTIWTR